MRLMSQDTFLTYGVSHRDQDDRDQPEIQGTHALVPLRLRDN